MGNFFISDTVDHMIEINQDIRLGDIVYDVRQRQILRAEPSLFIHNQSGISLFPYESSELKDLLEEDITFEYAIQHIKQIKYPEILKCNFKTPFTDEQVKTLKLLKEMI